MVIKGTTLSFESSGSDSWQTIDAILTIINNRHVSIPIQFARFYCYSNTRSWFGIREPDNSLRLKGVQI